MTPQLRSLVNAAKKELTENPFDEPHDVLHHYNVWDNAIHIIFHEKLQNVDLNLLTLAVWWHDVDRGDDTHPTLVKSAKELSIENDVLEKIIEVIDTHSFDNDRSESIEGKILYDADKIEYINPTRWLVLHQAIEEGRMKEERGMKYCTTLNSRIQNVFDDITYDYSRSKLIENIKLILEVKNQNLLTESLKNTVDWKLLEKLTVQN